VKTNRIRKEKKGRMANKTEYILLARRRMEGTNERKKERK
jgi:hypothetical protein